VSQTVISHAYPATPDSTFYPAVARSLEAAGIDVATPAMPQSKPGPAGWLPALKSAISASPAETALAGHSIGAWNIFRYLEGRGTDEEPFAGVVVVAAPAHYIHFPDLLDFFAEPIDWSRVQAGARTFTVICAPDDRILAPDSLAHGRALRDALGAKLLVLPTGGHFAPFDNCVDLPELTNDILQLLHPTWLPTPPRAGTEPPPWLTNYDQLRDSPKRAAP